MRREDFLRLVSEAGQQLLGEIDYSSKADLLQLVSKYRKAGHDPLTVAAALSQAKLRKRAEAKFGPFAAAMLFTEAGLEQASRLKVAAQHAARFRVAGITEVADLGCGIGAESMALGAIGIRVAAFEIDEVTAAVATYNLAPLDTVLVKQADVKEIDLTKFEGLFFDPARRELKNNKQKRVFDPKNYSPDYDFCITNAKTKPSGIKLGPGQDRSTIPQEAEAQWLSVSGELVELGLWFNAVSRAGVARSALLLTEDKQFEISSEASDSPNAEIGKLDEFVYEPDPSLIRSRLLGDFASAENLKLIAPEIAYLTSDRKISSPWLAGYRVIDEMAFDRKKLKSHLRSQGIGILEIKKRGSDISPEQLRKELAPKGEGAATLIISRVGDAHRVLVTQPISD